jgi:hypothetical protein
MKTEKTPYVYSHVLPIPSEYPPTSIADLGPYAPDGLHIKTEEDGSNWIIFYPTRPCDDDVHAIVWSGEKWIALAAGSGRYVYDNFDENAAMILLEYFGLMADSGSFPPKELESLTPQELLQLSKDTQAKDQSSANSYMNPPYKDWTQGNPD